jgi:hypothetical protein
MKYEVLFYLMNEVHSVVEVKRIDLDHNATPDEVFHWLSISSENNSVQRLNFVSQSEEAVKGINFKVREFENGSLRFDESYAKFVFNNDGHILMNCSEEKVPDQINKSILSYLEAT